MAPTIPLKRKVSVIERRLKSGDVWAVGAGTIPLKEPDRWVLRIASTENRPLRARELQNEKGWQFATAEDLAATPYEIGFAIQDGRLVRGAHSQEVLMKMERDDYAAVVRLKEADVRKHTFGQKATKDAILQAVQQQPGGDAGAEFLDRTVERIRVTDSRERVNLEE